MTVTRHAERFESAASNLRSMGYHHREAYDAICAIKRTFEQRMGFVEEPSGKAATPAPAEAPKSEELDP
jgi:hypothetical protein